MLRSNLRRGVAAGAVAGLLAGVVGLLLGAPTIDAAEDLEHAAGEAHDEDATAADHDHAHDDAEPLLTPGQSRAGLVGATLIAGVALGAVLGTASGAAARRLRGDAWARTWKLGGAAIGAVVVLPALLYPPVPPGGADPDTIGARTGLYLATVLLGFAIALAAGAVHRRLADAGVRAAPRQVATAVIVVAAATVTAVAMPSAASVGATAAGLPAELVWAFRLESLATQLTLWLAVTGAFGLLAARAERGERPRAAALP